MAKVNLFSNATRQPGVYETVAANVPTSVSRVRISCSRANLGALSETAECFKAEIWMSLDGGTTWFVAIGFGTCGGDVPAPGGGFEPESNFEFPVPGVGNANRKAKGVLTILAACKTSFDWEVF